MNKVEKDALNQLCQFGNPPSPHPDLRSMTIDDALNEENRRIVEHAPKLLKACEVALDWFKATSQLTGNCLGADVQQQLTEVITLATGKSPDFDGYQGGDETTVFPEQL